MIRLPLLTALLVAVATTALDTQAADKPLLKAGDPAPRLQSGKWVQGEPVKEFQKGTTYIVEFWATWCGPCRATIPHVNELQQKFKDQKLVVIGQDVWERDEAKVEPFVRQMGPKMTYRVAFDDKSQSPKGAMAETWMEAAGQNGIPSAFVVDKEGIIAWIGHPATLQEPMLKAILDGTFDLKKAAADAATTARNQEQLTRLVRKYSEAKTEAKWDVAESILQEIEPLLPTENRASLAMAKAELAFGRGDYKGGYRLVESYADTDKNNPQLQNQLAWYVASEKTLKKRDLSLAEKLARRAVEATGRKNAALLDTLARIQFMSDRKTDAVETQTAAVRVADGEIKAALQKTLDSYTAGKLPESQ